MKASLGESTHNKCVGFIKWWMVQAQDIDNSEIHHVVDFFECHV